MKRSTAAVVLTIIAIPTCGSGGLCLLWSFVCFLGGPDAHFGSHQSLIASAWFCLISSVLLTGGGFAAYYARRYFVPPVPKPGVCPRCGYDLRGTPDRPCPECGAPPAERK